MPVALPPFDGKLAAVHHQGRGAFAQPPAMGGHQGGAGAGAAGLGLAHAALPDLQPDAVGAEDLGEADIGALGEQPVVLDPWAGLFHRRGLGVGHEEHHVRIAHGDAAGPGELGIDLQVDLGGVHFQGQGDVAPVQAGFAHVDRDLAVARAKGEEDAGRRLDAHGLGARRLHHQPADAARGVATGRHLAAVGVPDAHAGVGPVRPADGDQLVAAHAGGAIGDRPGQLGAGRERFALDRHDDEIVAEAVHLQKRKAHGA